MAGSRGEERVYEYEYAISIVYVYNQKYLISEVYYSTLQQKTKGGGGSILCLGLNLAFIPHCHSILTHGLA